MTDFAGSGSSQEVLTQNFCIILSPFHLKFDKSTVAFILQMLLLS